jgi:putative nucleotidyltransferase with HDIG domain
MTQVAFKRSDKAQMEAEVRQRTLARMCESLELCFNAKFTVLDVSTGDCLLRGAFESGGSVQAQLELCRAVLCNGKAEFIAEEDPVVVLAIPLVDDEPARYVALAPFVIRTSDEATITGAATALGCKPESANSWAKRQSVWDSRRLMHLAELNASHWSDEFRAWQMQREIYDISSHLSAAYEELNLLYGLTQKLKISDSIEDLGRKSLEWLAEVISAEGFVLELLPFSQAEGEAAAPSHRQSAFLQFGHPCIDRFQLARMIEHLDLAEEKRPLVINTSSRDRDWPLPEIQQAVIVPLTDGDNLFGWLAALNREERAEFGSSEASLLSSVAAILGTHASNLALYRQQAEFLAGVVRALTSAIDAKDPYTCGHSDRVARISVRLADQLGCNRKELETLYLCGLLHDIGKIGIDDQVLRKPGKLTVAEYEHIKVHSEIGHRILKDLKQLDQVLPAVRHHHEAWDGSGYPRGLTGEDIPLYARIVAVADACDAMSSDRPYRKGIPEQKLDEILQEGAGSQWDPKVIDAYFAVRDEIRQIERPEVEESQIPELAIMS